MGLAGEMQEALMRRTEARSAVCMMYSARSCWRFLARLACRYWDTIGGQTEDARESGRRSFETFPAPASREHFCAAGRRVALALHCGLGRVCCKKLGKDKR